MNRYSLSRWEIAQNSEKDYWKNYSKKSLIKRFGEGYSKKSKYLSKEFEKIMEFNKKTKILQVGGAALDVINYIKTGEKYAIDPLADYYKKKFRINYKGIEFKKGTGENLPYPDKFFDVVILANVLDHVHSPKKVIDEAKRVLKKQGVLYLEVHIATKGFIIIASIWSFLQKFFFGKIFNIHHPHMFSIKDVINLTSNEFQIIKEELGKDYTEGFRNFKEFKNAKKKDKKLTIKVLAKLGIFGEINYSAFYRKID